MDSDRTIEAAAGRGEAWEVRHVTMDRAVTVHVGDLESCEDWIALEGDRFREGFFEIVPMHGSGGPDDR